MRAGTAGGAVGELLTKGHFLVMIADRDHILFDYLEKETGPAIYESFRGFSGYVQADAKAVFNLLFADADELKKKACDVEHDGATPTQVSAVLETLPGVASRARS